MLLQPTRMLKRVYDITPQFLAELGVKAVALDVDNTLTHSNSPAIEQIMSDWLVQTRREGFALIIISNNFRQRVGPFAQKLELDYIYNAKKPLPGGLAQACKKLGLRRGELLMVGDQLFTDILAANLFGCPSVLVEPFHIEQGTFMRLKRKAEIPFIRRIRRRQEAGR